MAGTLFRERGFDGIGVADIMKRAGLTHGGFYGQFASKDDLAAETTARVLGKTGWQERLTGKADGRGKCSGWRPTQAGLLEDVDRPSYFREPVLRSER